MLQQININGEIIAYEEAGSGEPILFIHPPGMGRKVFYEQKPLADNYRLILPDLVGQGDSSYQHDTEISVKRFAEDLISFLDHLQLETVILFGYSAGGIIAQYLCIHFPSRVKAVIMSGAYPIVDNFMLINEHRLGIFTVEKNKKFLSNVLARSHTKDKDFREVLKQHMYKSNTKVWSKFYFESLHFNCKDKLKHTNMPVFLLYGSKADAMNTYIKFYKKYVTNEIHMIQGEGHQLPTRRAEQVNQYIREFIGKL